MFFYIATNVLLIIILLFSIFLPSENIIIKSLLQAIAIMTAFNKEIIFKHFSFAPKIKIKNNPIRYGNKCNISLIIRKKIKDQVEIMNFIVSPSHIKIIEFRIDGKLKNPDDKFMLNNSYKSANIDIVVQSNKDRIPTLFEIRYMHDGNVDGKNLFLYKDIIHNWRGCGRKIMQYLKF